MICCIKLKTWFHCGYSASKSANLVLAAAWPLHIRLAEKGGICCLWPNVDSVTVWLQSTAHRNNPGCILQLSSRTLAAATIQPYPQTERKPLSLLLAPSDLPVQLQKPKVLQSWDARPDFPGHGDSSRCEYINTEWNWSGKTCWEHFHHLWKNS